MLCDLLVAHVTISGSDTSSVRKARELIEVHQEAYDVDEEFVTYFNRFNDGKFEAFGTGMFMAYMAL